MKEVWFINHFAISPDLPGGSRHYDFSVELACRNYSPSIFASDFSYLHRKYYKLHAKQLFCFEEINNVRFVWVKARAYRENNLQRVLNMLSFSVNVIKVGMRLGPPAIIVGSSPHLFAALAACFLSRLKKAKFVLEIRDLWPQVLVDMGKARENSFYIAALRVIERYLYKRADKIIVLAKGTVKYLLERNISPEKILFVPNGVNLQLYRALLTRDEARAKYQFDRFTCVYTGAHGPANALYTILKAAKCLEQEKNIEFVLLGDGPEKKQLQDYALAHKIHNVRFLDPIMKKEMADFLLAADIGIITLAKVGLFSYGVSPNKLFHYMGAKLPIVCSVAGEMGELVQEIGAGISIFPEDAVSLADAVLQLYHCSDNTRKQMGENGFRYVSENFTSEKQAEKLVEMFDRLYEKDNTCHSAV